METCLDARGFHGNLNDVLLLALSMSENQLGKEDEADCNCKRAMEGGTKSPAHAETRARRRIMFHLKVRLAYVPWFPGG